jgi:hypothetical protein
MSSILSERYKLYEIMEYLIQTDTFTWDDYKILLTNDGDISVFIPYIKHKFGLEPILDLILSFPVNSGTNRLYCRYNNKNLIELLNENMDDLNKIDKILDYETYEGFDVDVSIENIMKMIDKDYLTLIKSYKSYFKIKIDLQMLSIISYIEKYGEFKYIFANFETMCEYIKYKKIFNTSIMEKNKYTDEEYKILYEILKNNEIKIIDDTNKSRISSEVEKHYNKICKLKNL